MTIRTAPAYPPGMATRPKTVRRKISKTNRYHLGIGDRVARSINQSKGPVRIADLAGRLTIALGRAVSRQAVERHVNAMIEAGTVKRAGRGLVERTR